MKNNFIIFKKFIIYLIGTLLFTFHLYGYNNSPVLYNTQSSPEIFVPTDLFPSNGKYETESGTLINWPSGLSLRYLGNRDFSQFDSLPTLGSGWKIFNFNSTMAYQISYDGGLIWNNGIAQAFNSIRLNHVADTGTSRYFDAEVLALNIAGGMLPAAVIFRESPGLSSSGKIKVTDVINGYLIESFFDIWLELSVDGGLSWTPALSPIRIEFSYYPEEYSFLINLFPPSEGSYISDIGDSISFTPGVMVRNIVKKYPDASIPPPPPMMPVVHSYNDSIFFQISLDQGETWLNIEAPCVNTVQINYTITDNLTTLYACEFLSINVSGGNLPPGVLIRESPTLTSSGQFTTTTGLIGNRISSFFDIFLEISVNGGMSWGPADNSIKVELFKCPVITIYPSTLSAGQIGQQFSDTLNADGGTPPYTYSILSGKLPPGLTLSADGIISGTPTDYGFYNFQILVKDQHYCTVTLEYLMTIYSAEHFCGSAVYPPYGRYVSKMGESLSFPIGIVIKNIKHRTLRPPGVLPPLGSDKTFDFTGIIGLEISYDLGATFSFYEIPTANIIYVNHMADSLEESFFDAEIIQMDIKGGDLPTEIFLRESPTISSPGRISIKHQGSGYRIDSFFDLFTEISVDGGMVWIPAMNDIKMELNFTPPILTNTDNYPPSGINKSPKDKAIIAANGIGIRNVRHYNFQPQESPPSLGNTKIFNYGGMVEFELTTDGGLNWDKMQASTTNSSSLFHYSDDGLMNFYDAEMIQFDIVGGTLPPGLIIRENPTRSSTGDYNTRLELPDSWWADSFFDIFIEISSDGGMLWTPVKEPLMLTLEETSLEITVNTNWNMISLPLEVENGRKTTLFPSAVSPAYAYEGNYVEKDTLINGIGYWLKFDGPENIKITGKMIFEDTINVVEGWNLIGAISIPIEAKNISSIPWGIITSEFFGYTTAYNAVDTIQPGNGYWVKVSEAGQLILSSAGEKSLSSLIKIIPYSELPPPPPNDKRMELTQDNKPFRFYLHQNTPNPFNPVTAIQYELPIKSKVTLKVFNIFGQEIVTLVDGIQDAGFKTVEFNGNSFASGVYFYQLNVGNQILTRKMVLCK